MIELDWLRELTALVSKQHVFNFALASFFFLGGIFLARRVSLFISKLSQLTIQQRVLFSKVAYYGLITLAITAGLSQMGFNLKVLLGAAGILTVAIGFAAQTSASNLISGIFLIIERPFTVGDDVSIGEIRGEVMSIDLLSTKIRTFNNLMVRVPNETMVKSSITNHSFFPIRRVDFLIGVSYSADLKQVEEILRKVATDHPMCMMEPEPVFRFVGFGDSSMNLEFQVWTTIKNIVPMRNDLFREIKSTFDKEGIEIPFPTRTLISAQSPPASTAEAKQS